MRRIQSWAVAVLLGAALVAPASAGTLEPSSSSQVVTLTNENSTPTCIGGGVQIDLQVSGSGARSPFGGIPTGKVLVLTGAGVVSSANATTPVGFLIDVEGGQSSLWFGAGVDGTTVLVPHVIVSSGQTLCVRAPNLPAFGAYLHGFLAPDK